VIAGVVSYMLLCWGGGGFRGIVYTDIFSLIFGTSCSQRGVFPSSRVLVCVPRLGTFGFLREREQVCQM